MLHCVQHDRLIHRLMMQRRKFLSVEDLKNLTLINVLDFSHSPNSIG